MNEKLINELETAAVDPGLAVGTAWDLLDKAADALRAANSRLMPVPNSLHWLGDREEAEASRHALDQCGCVMYFDTEEECAEFMLFVSNYPRAANE